METILIILLSIVLFVGLWTGARVLGARLLGWAELARAYRFAGSFQGDVWLCRSCQLVRMKWDGYEESLNTFFPALPRDIPDDQRGMVMGEVNLGANPEGLYLAPSSFCFRPGHPPLLIPWHDVAVTAERAYWINYLAGSRFWPPERDACVAKDSWAWVACLVLRFRRAPGVLLQIRESEGRRLAAAAASSWPGPPQLQTTASSLGG